MMEEKVFQTVDNQYIRIGAAPLRIPMEFSVADIVLGFAMLVCGFCYWNFIDLSTLGAGVTAFSVLLCAVTLVYFQKKGIKQTGRSLACLAVVIASAVQFSIFDILVVKSLNFLFLTLVFMVWVCVSTSRQLEKGLSVYLIGDFINQAIVVPFSNFACCICGVREGIGKNKKGKGILSLLIGIVVILPIFVGVISLLMSADSAFENFARNVFGAFNIVNMGTYLWQLILGVPVAFYIYGLVYGDVTGRHAADLKKASMDKAASAVRIAPRLTVYGGLTMFNALYLVYFAVQAAYFFSAFGGILPEGFTYAEYARRGFFELCTVAGINLFIMALAYVMIKREPGEEPKVLRTQTVAISLFTMLLIATAISKMVIYIQSYGLTQLRVLTSWFMVLLFFIFAVVLIRQLKRFNASRVIIAGFLVLFMALSYGNLDGNIAKYNLRMYEAGVLEKFDYSMVARLSDGAVPYIYEFYQTTENEELKASAHARLFLSERAGDLRDWNWQSYQAAVIKEEMR